MAHETCNGCGYTLAPGDQTCPRCKRPVSPERPPAPGQTTAPARRSPQEEREELYRVEKVERAEGQDPPGSWGYFAFIAKRDPLLATVFALLALNVVINLMDFDLLGLVVSAAVFWAVYTFQSWGWWVAVICSAVGALLALYALSAAPVLGAILMVIPCFTLVVLWRRK